jgi:hypothetical protein
LHAIGGDSLPGGQETEVRIHRRIALALAFALTVGLAPRADSQDCPGWFPDLSGCERPARYEGFTAPVGMPFLFEEPFINTGASLWGLWHDLPESSVFEGGEIRAVAAQLRVALTGRLALIATKDGWIELRPDLDLLDTEKGYGDLGLGLKYALIDDPDRRIIVTPSLRYEATQGSGDVLQGNGEGMWVPGLSAGIGMGPANLTAGLGATLPLDGDAESGVLFYGLQLALPLGGRFTPFVGLNGLHYLDSGDGSGTIETSLGRLPIDTVQNALGTGRFEGLDVANLGSRGVEGHDVIGGSLGFRLRLTERLDLGFAYERPLTRRRDLLKQRATLNLLFEL